MPIERIRRPAGLSQPGLYSHVVRAGNTAYIAGQVAMDENGNTVGKGDFAAQTVQVMENLGRALASVGATYKNLVKTTIFVTDPRYRETLTEVRARYMDQDALAASTLVVVAGLASPDYLLEIEGIAVLE